MSKWTDDDWKKLYESRVARFERLQKLNAPQFILSQEAYLVLLALRHGRFKTYRWIIGRDIESLGIRIRCIPMDVWFWWKKRQGQMLLWKDRYHMKDCQIYQALRAGKPVSIDDDDEDECIENAMPWWAWPYKHSKE